MSHPPPEKEPSVTIYYDGSCPMCTAIIGTVEKSTQAPTFLVLDIKSATLPTDFSSAQVEKEMHVVDANGVVYKNAAAILKIMEAYPRLTPLVKIGRLPFVTPLLPIGYRFIAANRHFLTGERSRVFWLKVVAIIGLLASLLLSLPLWTHGRLFPHAPVFPGLTLPPLFETTLFITLVGLLLGSLFSARPQKYIFASLTTITLLIVFDQMRLQPWVYLYSAVLLTLALFSWKPGDAKGLKATLNTARLIIASTYFFSGLQKLNLTFIAVTYPWMAEPIIALFPPSTQILPLSFGVLVPLLEMILGVSLITKRFRMVGLSLAFLMLSFVLFTIGPLGHNWNNVVWPWNIGIALCVLILFWRTEFSWRDVLTVRDSLFRKIIVLLFLIMPFLSFLKLWDSYLSWSLYSGNTTSAIITLPAKDKSTFPPPIQEYVKVSDDGVMVELNPLIWSFDELDVPIYPEVRVYTLITKALCVYTPGLRLEITERPLLWYPPKQYSLDCHSL